MFVYLCADARSALEETGEHDAVPLVSAVVLRPDLSVVAAHDPADVQAQNCSYRATHSPSTLQLKLSRLQRNSVNRQSDLHNKWC